MIMVFKKEQFPSGLPDNSVVYEVYFNYIILCLVTFLLFIRALLERKFTGTPTVAAAAPVAASAPKAAPAAAPKGDLIPESNLKNSHSTLTTTTSLLNLTE
jgi:hypothetical protein